MYVTVSALGVALAWTLLLLQVEPVPTWFYVFVWYPTLTLADGVSSRIRGDPPLLSHPGLVASLFLWSPVVWLLFEAINFRIANWYYVFLPAPLAERWTGILLSFATVVPAVILAERMLHALGSGRRWRIRPIRTRSWELHAALLIGLASLALALARPQLFFPLVWGAVWLLADPYVARHRAEWSLLRDLEKGEVGRIVRLMLGGLAIGLLWESYNAWARGKWIYTVPWLEELKLFEMPPFGFLGFPFFALRLAGPRISGWIESDGGSSDRHPATCPSTNPVPRRRHARVGILHRNIAGHGAMDHQFGGTDAGRGPRNYPRPGAETARSRLRIGVRPRSITDDIWASLGHSVRRGPRPSGERSTDHAPRHRRGARTASRHVRHSYRLSAARSRSHSAMDDVSRSNGCRAVDGTADSTHSRRGAGLGASRAAALPLALV
jgi:hypothetical protein